MEKKKNCFVIMPYGGDDTDKRKHFNGVYQSIICQAAQLAHCEVKRSDIAGEPGNITHDIIRDLASADIVIADLTTGNSNVFFELGIRHALRKSGTVHIVDSNYKIPFDVRQYRVIEYSTDLSEVPQVVQKIADAINKRFEQPNRADNPVHDAIPDLPLDYLSYGEEAIKKQLEENVRELKVFMEENQELKNRLEILDPKNDMMNPDGFINIDALLDEAEVIMETSGEHALLKLRHALDNDGPKLFVKELRNILKSQYLDENDIIEISLLCRNANLEGHRRAVLEIALKRFPDSVDIVLAFVDALDDSPSPKDQERGKRILEKEIGIEHKDDKIIYVRPSHEVDLSRALPILFNFYFKRNRNNWVIDLIDGLPQSFKKDARILRNKARALAKTSKIAEAEETFKEALEMDPTDDQTILFYAEFLDDQDRIVEAYEMSESAILADPEDPRLWRHLSIQIYNKKYFRNSSGEIKGPFPKKAATQAMIPFIQKAAELATTIDMIQELVKILVRADMIEAANSISQGETLQGDFNYEPFDYILGKIPKE